MANHPVDVHVGKKLRQRRTILGMTQDALAKAVGITFQQVQKYERGVNRMGASRLFEFSRVVNVPISYFYEGFKDESTKAGRRGVYSLSEEALDFEQEILSSKETLELFKSFARISDAKLKRKVIDLVRSISETEVKPAKKAAKKAS